MKLTNSFSSSLLLLLLLSPTGVIELKNDKHKQRKLVRFVKEQVSTFSLVKSRMPNIVVLACSYNSQFSVTNGQGLVAIFLFAFVYVNFEMDHMSKLYPFLLH